MVSPIERGGPTELTAAFDLARFARSAMVLPRLRGGAAAHREDIPSGTFSKGVSGCDRQGQIESDACFNCTARETEKIAAVKK